MCGGGGRITEILVLDPQWFSGLAGLVPNHWPSPLCGFDSRNWPNMTLAAEPNSEPQL